MSKISELSDGGALQSTDYLIAVRSGGNVKVQPGSMTVDINGGTIDGVTIGGSSAGAGTFTNLTATGTTTLAGASTTADITFGDNDKAIFGAGSDLQIYHDGSRSIIYDGGTGELSIRANGPYAEIMNGGATETMARFNNNGSVDLYYDNSQKLATTSTGIDVTGTVTATSFNGFLEGGVSATPTNSDNATIYTASGSHPDYASTDLIIQARSSAARSIYMLTGTTTPVNRLQVDGNGDISFYEDTGTTAKFFWDASAEALGIGTSSPSSDLHIYEDANTDTTLKIENPYSGGGSAYASTQLITNAGTAILGLNSASRGFLAGTQGFYISSPAQMVFAPNATEAMRIDSSGNVGIGTDSPVSPLHVESGANGNIIQANGSSTAWDFILKGTNGNDADSFLYEMGMYRDDGTTNPNTVLKFGRGAGVQSGFFAIDQNGSEAMRIDSSQNLLVGTTSFSTTTAGIKLDADGDIAANRDGDAAAFFGRLTSDGEIVRFRKDGSTVGSIGAAVGTTYIDGNSSSTGLFFAGASILPRDGGAGSNGGVDLGESAYRWKNLYLSGGVYLGGTGAANLLDDYEEGTFTPELRDATSGGNTATTTHKFGNYTKVGNLVTIWMHFRNIDTTGMTSGNAISITGLPFTADNNMYTSAAVSTDRVSFSGNYLTFTVTENAAYGPISIITSNAQDASLTVAGIDGTGSDIQGICVQYRTA